MTTGDAAAVADLLAAAAKVLASAEVDSPVLDAEVLLAEAFGRDRTWLFARLSEPVPQEVHSRFDGFVDRRRDREPVAYIRGRKEFMSIEFEVNRSVLIPRPETETLVATALDFLGGLDHDQHVIDLCTGSGCVAVAMAVLGRKCLVEASDISSDALEVARRNAAKAGVESRVTFRHGDLYDAFAAGALRGAVDAVVANPPYVAEDEWSGLPPEASRHEPRLALAAGEDGFEIVRRVIEGSVQWLRPGGLLLVEMAPRQTPSARELAEQTGHFAEVDDVHTIDGTVCGIKAKGMP
jgi:release factor glutamine methyltransferase